MRISFFTIFLLIAFTGFSQNAELRFLQTINRNEHPTWDKSMRFTSMSAYVLAPVAVIIPFAQGYAQKNNELQRSSIKSAIGIGLAMGCSTGLKFAIHRDRPYAKYPNEIIKRDQSGPHSFPSGHTTAAFATATALTLTYKSWYVGVPAYLYAGLVGYSRMRLGMHYPSDIVGGMIIGIGAGLLTWKLDAVINHR